MKLLFNALYQSVPSLDVEVIMRLETTRLQDDLLNDVADCGIALPPSPKRALSRFQATLLQVMVIILLHLLNQNSHNQLKYVSHSRKYSALQLESWRHLQTHVYSNDTCPVCLTTKPIS